MKYDYTAEFMQAMLRNIGNLLLLSEYRTHDNHNTVAYLYKKLRPVNFQKPTAPELWSYLKLIDTLKPVSVEGKRAVTIARDDLQYLLMLKGID